MVSRATYWRHRDASAAREVIWEDAIQSKDDVESMDDIEEDVDDSDVDDDSDGVTDEGGFRGFLHHTTTCHQQALRLVSINVQPPRWLFPRIPLKTVSTPSLAVDHPQFCLLSPLSCLH